MSSEASYSENDSNSPQAESSPSPSSSQNWVQWFCSLEGHDFLAEITEDYLHDKSNLYGLHSKIPNFQSAYEQILSGETPDEEDLQNDDFLELYHNSIDLYGLVHARFIQTPVGLAIMREKYLAGKFGVCSRVLCERHNVMPVGMSNEVKSSRVKVYCPRCQDVYYPKDKSAEVDGAYFGTSFPHVLMQNFPFLYPLQERVEYCAKICGFKVHKGRGVFSERIEEKYRPY